MHEEGLQMVTILPNYTANAQPTRTCSSFHFAGKSAGPLPPRRGVFSRRTTHAAAPETATSTSLATETLRAPLPPPGGAGAATCSASIARGAHAQPPSHETVQTPMPSYDAR